MVEVLHIPCFSSADPIPVLRESLDRLSVYKRIGVVSSSQHLNRLDDVAAVLKQAGKEIVVGGQVLGCRQDNAVSLDVDAILYVGSGRFHPLGVAVKTDLPVFILNPISQVFDVVSSDERKRYLGRRKASLVRALESEVFGVLVSSKDGQMDMKKALEVKSFLEGRGKKAYIIAAEELSPNNLLPLKVDCFVNTACPRMEADCFHRPVVNSDDLTGFLS
ncbi:MAG: diphthamide synthesis protein [Candidatus Altiarchaeota archaeon]|nr:diphthamide synthesis protein [Candidatus Altiarchaeota archaeon]